MVKKKTSASNGQTEPLPESLDMLKDELAQETGFKITPIDSAARPAFKVGDVVYIKRSALLVDSDDQAALTAAEHIAMHAEALRQLAAERYVASRPTERLRRAVDWFPSPRTRKVLAKMVADQEALIAKLMTDGRVNTARWQIGVTWVLLAYTGTLHLISSLASAIRGKQRTN